MGVGWWGKQFLSVNIGGIYRVYTKEWCGFNSEHYYNRTILLCMPCITNNYTLKDHPNWSL